MTISHDSTKKDLINRRLWVKSNLDVYLSEMRKDSKRRRITQIYSHYITSEFLIPVIYKTSSSVLCLHGYSFTDNFKYRNHMQNHASQPRFVG
ncbi:DnaJ domain-containing protein [Artemisia annua]|uniref:DnaJ domain-containing protein n=1 Tax=Artemisia annua TaxID=35608 RepID=A0A2U1MIZ9_ARTAN|nr:DnaJ domain-containing protein [Artemisia annua]